MTTFHSNIFRLARKSNLIKFDQVWSILDRSDPKNQKLGSVVDFLFTKRHLHTKFQKILSNRSQDNLWRTDGQTDKGESIGPVSLKPGTNKGGNKELGGGVTFIKIPTRVGTNKHRGYVSINLEFYEITRSVWFGLVQCNWFYPV